MKHTSLPCPNAPQPVAKSVDRGSDYDVIVIGGAFSGSSSAILLKRKFPDLKILIIEKSEVFDRKVGESTSEIAGCFLTQVLKQGRHLALNHVSKHGLRMWFHRDSKDLPSESTEVGPAGHGPFPTFQLNRLTLDTHLLEEAVSLGCELIRPGSVSDLKLLGAGKNSLTIKQKGSEPRQVTAGWVIDSSGKASLIARSNELWQSNADSHPVSSMWTRFRNARDLDSADAAAQMTGLSDKVFGQRGYSTNHLMGYGWWSWIIPLDSGEVSVGLTWDDRIFTPPADGSMAERLKKHLVKHPIGKLMFADAEAVENDNRYYKGLAYYSEETAGDGWTIVGDAAGFMDPLYSQGLDFCSHTIYASYTLIRKYFLGDEIESEIQKRVGTYRESYSRWFEALYQDKYYYIGDSELMYTAYLLDLSNYFLGPTKFVYGDQDGEFPLLPFHGPIGGFVARYMAFYNKRLSILARKKIRKGTYGDHNSNDSFIVPKTFTTGKESVSLSLLGLRRWFWTELRYALVRPAEVEEPTMSTPLPKTMSPLRGSAMSKDQVLSEG